METGWRALQIGVAGRGLGAGHRDLQAGMVGAIVRYHALGRALVPVTSQRKSPQHPLVVILSSKIPSALCPLPSALCPPPASRFPLRSPTFQCVPTNHRLPHMDTDIPEAPACCCGSEDCAFLKHNGRLLEGLERDVNKAAVLGKVCFHHSMHTPPCRPSTRPIG